MSAELKQLMKQDEDESFNVFRVKIFVRGVQIKTSNIISVNIVSSIFQILPTINLTWNDYGLFSDVFPLGDNDDIEIEISTDAEKVGIKSTFTINDYKIAPQSLETYSNCIISCTGFLKNKSMFQIKSKAFRKTLSTNALEDIFTDEGFPVDSIIKSKDTMTWLQSSRSIEAVQSILDYSYVGEDNILFAYVDKNSLAHIIDLKSAIDSPKKFDLVKAIRPYDHYNTQIKNPDGTTGELKSLGYNDFILNFIPGYDNKTGGYGVKGIQYDYDARPTSMISKNIFKPMTDYSLKNKEVAAPYDYNYQSMRYKNSNVHTNYHKAYLQNKYIRKTFFSSVLLVKTFFNNEVNLLDVLDLNMDALAHSGSNKPEQNKVYSGKYLVTEITSSIATGGIYTSKLRLCRGGINNSAFTENTEMKIK